MPGTFRNAVIALAVGAALAGRSAHADTVSYMVGAPVKGQIWNDFLKRWFDGTIQVNVMVSDGRSEYLRLIGDTGLGPATAQREMSVEDRDRMRADVKKAGEWIKIARSKKATISKMLSCYASKGSEDLCMQFGVLEQGEIGLRLVSQNSGDFVRIEVDIIDSANRYLKSSIYLDAAGIAALSQRLQTAESLFKKAHAESEKANLFK